MKSLLLLATVLFLFPVQCLAQSASKTGLTRLLEAELARFPAKAGVYVKSLGTGEEAGIRADDAFNSLSVIKIPIMLLAYQLADQKKLSLDERVEIRMPDYRGGSGIFSAKDPGLSPTIRDLITEMIITSDNTATDIMIKKVGGLDRVNEWLASNGYGKTKLVQTVYEVFRKRYEMVDAKYKSLTPEELFALQTNHPLFTASRENLIRQVQEETRGRRIEEEFRRRWSDDPTAWLGIMTPRETAEMLETIERETVASKQSCEEMKRIMRRQQAGARRIPHFLDVPVAHKTGDGPPVGANDVGMVYAKSGTIIISFFTTNIREPFAELEDRIGRVSKLIVDYFEGAP